jgi:hypothetical protein
MASTRARLVLVCVNRFLGPEVAGMATLGPLIVLRFWRDES